MKKELKEKADVVSLFQYSFAITSFHIFVSMKIFAGIFSLYILATAVMPCTDMYDCKYQMNETLSSALDADHSNHEKDEEHCPPFCLCTCCGQTFSTDHIQFHIPANNSISKQEYLTYTSAFLPEVYFNIWQPPKIS